MTKTVLSIFLLVALAAPSTAQPAAKAGTGTPKQIASLLACRPLSDAAERLACFDREMAGFATAITGNNLVVIDRERVREAKKGLFGFSVPSFGGLFGGGGEDEVNQLDGVVASASRNPEGGWTIRLVDGSAWTQTDDAPLALGPKKGNKIVVRRGTLGSFRLSVNGQPGVKVKRVG